MAEQYYLPTSFPPPPSAPAYIPDVPPPQQRPPPPPPPHVHPFHHPEPDSPKPHAPQPVKVAISLSAFLFSLLTISLSYAAVFTSAEIYHVTIAPLVTSTVFLVVAIISALFLCTIPGRTPKLAIVPTVFAAVSGSMIILLNVSSKALSDGGFVDVNFLAVLLSAGVFGGIALGTSTAFLLFADAGRG